MGRLWYQDFPGEEHGTAPSALAVFADKADVGKKIRVLYCHGNRRSATAEVTIIPRRFEGQAVYCALVGQLTPGIYRVEMDGQAGVLLDAPAFEVAILDWRRRKHKPPVLGGA